MGLFDGKLRFLIVFAVVYGFVFINYIDNISSSSSQGYHLWLVLMYFLPFVGLCISDLKNWKLALSLGLIASLMNDVFYGIVRNIMGFPLDLKWYYNLWLIPQNPVLFHLNLGFAGIPVSSWMMASSIYARIAAVFVLLKWWNIPLFRAKGLRLNVMNKNPQLVKMKLKTKNSAA